MTIAFVHKGNAILPEIAAYRKFFESMGFSTLEANYHENNWHTADIHWLFMGIYPRRASREALLIHEYASLSAAPFASAKNLLKKWCNCQPDFRIFLNEYTRKGFSFRDDIPWGIRSTVIVSGFGNLSQPEKKYDFVYAGTLEKSRKPEQWLRWFLPGAPLENRELLVVGPRRKELEQKFAYPWIHFHRQVEPHLVNEYIVQARFGINYQPNCEPFNRQPSSKLLSYASVNLPIISTDYQWVRDFQKQYGGQYFFIPAGSDKFTWKQILEFSYETPELKEWSVEYQIKQSGILEFLSSKGYLPEIRKTAK